MQTVRTKTISSLCAAALLAAAPFSLGAAGLTAGGSVGTARINSSNFDDDNTGAKGFLALGGDMLGVEAQYIDFGSYSMRLGGDADFDAITVAGTIGIPLAWARPYGKIGYAFQDVEGQSVSQEASDDEVFYGVGIGFGPERSPLSVRLEYERFEFDGDDLDMASLGLGFRFGGAR